MKRWIVMLGLILTTGAGGAMEADIQQWHTESGTKVLFVERHELPIVDLRVAFDAGSARDGDHPGLARLTSELLLEGTEAQDAGEIARSFERYGARVSTNSGRDTGEFSLRGLSDPARLEPVIEELAAVMQGASFPADALERVRRQMLLGLQQAKSSAADQAERAFTRAIYGDHPYASPPSGTTASVEALDRQAVVDFHTRHYTANNAVLTVVGDLTRARAEAIAEQLSQALPAGEALPPLPEVELPDGPQTVRVPFEAGQTHVMVGQPSVRRGDEAYYPLYMGNHMLGGSGLTSILAERMREDRGLSYSSSSRLSTGAQRGRFQMATQVRNEALGEALEVLRGSFAELRDEGPSEERMEASRRNITGSFPLQLDSNRDLLGYVSSIGFHDLPHDYLQQFMERIETMDRQTVQAALQSQLDPEHMITVLVGPEAVINGVD